MFKLSFESDPVRRTMLIHPVLDQFLGQHSREERIGRLRGDLEAFVRGDEIAMSVTPHKHGGAYMGVLEPVEEGIWEIRSRDPRPGMRVLGQFPCKDTFLAFDVRIRSRPDPRWPELVPLGHGKSIEYHIAQIDVLARWKALFPEFTPLCGDDVSVLLSDKYHLI